MKSDTFDCANYKIAFIVPSEDIKAYAIRIIEQYKIIKIYVGLATDAAELMDQFTKDRAQVIIARSEMARTLRKLGDQIPVVEVPVTTIDLIQAAEALRSSGPKIALVCFPDMVQDLEWIGNLLNVTFTKFIINEVEEVENAVEQVHCGGFDSVLGGGITFRAVAKKKVLARVIPMGKQAIIQAARHALEITEAIDILTQQKTLLNTLIEQAYEGIITVNASGLVNFFNPAAERLTKVTRNEAMDRNISEVIPEFDLQKTLYGADMEIDQLLLLTTSRVVCSKSPIIIDNRVHGAIATFQDASRIEKIEAVIRQKVHNRGHIAKFKFNDVIGRSPIIKEVIDIAKDYARTDFSVLISGETGTGKEVFAQSIHNYNERSRGPFVAINCAAIPEQILESELFGYVAGAFTGATKEGKLGLFEIAHNGTIFLDEVSEMDYLNQGRLLRFLQERTVRRLGSDRNIPVNVRIVAATNKDLSIMVEAKKFREDLYYRLNVLNLKIPPLRERCLDVDLFIDKFVAKHTEGRRRNIRFSQPALAMMRASHWSGNVRELENFVVRLVVTSKSEEIDLDQISMFMSGKNLTVKKSENASEIESALLASKGKIGDAANILGVNRSTLWRQMKKHNLR